MFVVQIKTDEKNILTFCRINGRPLTIGAGKSVGNH